MKLRPADIEPTPDVFATVMATGIVSIAVWLTVVVAGLLRLRRTLAGPRDLPGLIEP
jgi:hypothetical protein